MDMFATEPTIRSQGNFQRADLKVKYSSAVFLSFHSIEAVRYLALILNFVLPAFRYHVLSADVNAGANQAWQGWAPGYPLVSI